MMSTVRYNGKDYLTRTFEVINDGFKESITIADEALMKAFGDDIAKWGDEANNIDEQIYFYLEVEKLELPASEIAEKHLDEPMEFVSEGFVEEE